jgi:hypothetical protein
VVLLSEFLATDPEVRVWFPVLSDFLVVSLERGPLSLVSTVEELLGRKRISSDLENRDYGRRGFVTLTTWHLLSAKVGTNFTELISFQTHYS